MTTEDRVMAKLAESNPVPDIEAIDLVQIGSPSYLAAFEQRRSEVTNLQTRNTESESRRRLSAPQIAAAVAVVLLGSTIYLATQWSEETPLAASSAVASIEAPAIGNGFPPDGSLATIERFLTTNDYDSLVGLVTADWLAARAPVEITDIDYEALSRAWSDYWAAEEIMDVERTLDVNSCDGSRDTLVTCTIVYTSNITRALGEPYVERSTFKFVGNRIDIGDLPAPTLLFSEFAAYAQTAEIRDQFDDLCAERHPDNLRLPNHRRPGPACATFIMDNLEGWVEAVSADGGG